MRPGKAPRDSDRYQWTNHVVQKMRYYGLSEGRVRRVLNSPKRVEEGVAPGTTAIMQPGGTSRHPYEVWVMYQMINSKFKNPARGEAPAVARLALLGQRQGRQNSKLAMKRRRIISAWKYPGFSKPKGEIPMPEDVRRYIADLKN